MAKKALLTIDGVYRKVKGGYLTIDGAYRKVKKAYLTVGGVYRPCWSGGGTLAYYGAVDAPGSYLYDDGLGGGASANSKYAIFRMPYTNLNYGEDIYTKIAAVDKDLTFVAPGRDTGYYANTEHGVAATAGDKVVFAHGMGVEYDEDQGVYWAQIPYYMCGYDASLTLTGNYECENRGEGVAATSFGGCAWFAGGHTYGYQWDYDYEEEYYFSEYSKRIDAYDSSYTRKINFTGLTAERAYMASAASAYNAMFMGGFSEGNYGMRNGVAITGDSFTAVTPPDMSGSRYSHAAASVGGYILFVGADKIYATDAVSKCVDIYNKSLTRTSGTDLPEGRWLMLATSFGDFAIFAGGISIGSTSDSKKDAYAYDTSLTRTQYTMSKYVNCLIGSIDGGHDANSGCAVIGNFALFGPVYTHGTLSNTTHGLEVFTRV